MGAHESDRVGTNRRSDEAASPTRGRRSPRSEPNRPGHDRTRRALHTTRAVLVLIKPGSQVLSADVAREPVALSATTKPSVELDFVVRGGCLPGAREPGSPG